ncbi:hypothetical protein ACTHGU_20355 [Chitinophagaceae bacterium MMS25-I14]
METFDFVISANGPVSAAFRERNIYNFKDAAGFICMLPYGRNPDKTQLLTVFSDGCGTCSTKHALLKLLADENSKNEVQLILGIFKMSAENTPPVAETLKNAGLTYIPEAHNYMRINGTILDCTKRYSSAADFVGDLIIETEIAPAQITDFKVTYQKAFLSQWLLKHPEIKLSPNELWTVREQCIADLSGK